jgi:hypothetical protein
MGAASCLVASAERGRTAQGQGQGGESGPVDRARVNPSSLDRGAFRNPGRDKHNQPEKPAEHPKGPGELGRVWAGHRVCAQPNSKDPCANGQDQAQEIDEYSRVSESSKTVLCHKPLSEFSGSPYIGSIYLKGLRVPCIAIVHGRLHNREIPKSPGLSEHDP